MRLHLSCLIKCLNCGIVDRCNITSDYGAALPQMRVGCYFFMGELRCLGDAVYVFNKWSELRIYRMVTLKDLQFATLHILTCDKNIGHSGNSQIKRFIYTPVLITAQQPLGLCKKKIISQFRLCSSA